MRKGLMGKTEERLAAMNHSLHPAPSLPPIEPLQRDWSIALVRYKTKLHINQALS